MGYEVIVFVCVHGERVHNSFDALRGASALPNGYEIAALKCRYYSMESFSHRVRLCFRGAVAAVHLSDSKVKALCRQVPRSSSLSGLGSWHSKNFFSMESLPKKCLL